MLKQLRRLQSQIRIIRKLLPIILSLRGWDYEEGEKLMVGYLEVLRDNLKSNKAFKVRSEFRAYQIDKWIKLYKTITEELYPDVDLEFKNLKANNTLWKIYAKYRGAWFD